MILPAEGFPVSVRGAPDVGATPQAFRDVIGDALDSGERLAHVTANTAHRADLPPPPAAILWRCGPEVAAGVDPEGGGAWRPLSVPEGFEWRGEVPTPGVFAYRLRSEGGAAPLAACVAAFGRADPDAAATAWREVREAASWADGLPVPAIPEGEAWDLAALPPRPWLFAVLLPGVIEAPASAHWLADWSRCWAWAYGAWSRFADRRAGAA